MQKKRQKIDHTITDAHTQTHSVPTCITLADAKSAKVKVSGAEERRAKALC